MKKCWHFWRYLGQRCYRCRECGEHRIMDPPRLVPEYLREAERTQKFTAEAMENGEP